MLHNDMCVTCDASFDARVRSNGELKGLRCNLCCILPEGWEAGFNDGNSARYLVRCGADQMRARRLPPATHPLRKKLAAKNKTQKKILRLRACAAMRTVMTRVPHCMQ